MSYILHYYGLAAKCDYPVFQTTFLTVMNFSDPAIQDTNITFSCPPGLALIGSDTSMCTENGEWDKDLWSLRCKGKLEQWKLAMHGPYRPHQEHINLIKRLL